MVCRISGFRVRDLADASAVTTLWGRPWRDERERRELPETSGASKINMEVVGGGESAPNAGALPIDIPFAKTVGASPEPHAAPFLPSAAHTRACTSICAPRHTRLRTRATRTCIHTARARTHTHDWPCDADWLIERRVLSKGSYQKALRTVHAKIAAALAEERPDCPGVAEVLPPGIEQEKVSYATCCRVLELLKEGGLLAEKSFLGSYTNPHAARWADIVKRYEAGSIFLVDMAQGLTHNCTYELPAIKKDMGRAQKELHELERKQANPKPKPNPSPNPNLNPNPNPNTLTLTP